MTQRERDQVELVCGLQMIDDHLHAVEDGIGELMTCPSVNADRVRQINSLLGDVFFLLGQEIESAESAIVVTE